MKKFIYLTLITSLLIGLTVVESTAQYRSKTGYKNKYRFNAGIVLGANFSQIDGDHYSGFDKRGIRAGVKGMIYLNKKLDITTGITFVQRGSRFEDYRSGVLNRKNDRKIHLNYIEVPLLLTYKLLKKDGKGYRIDLGGSFARLFNSEIKEVVTPFTEVYQYGILEDQLQSNEFNFMAAASYFLNSRLGIGLQFTLQLNKLYNNPNFFYDPNDWDTPYKDVEHLQNYQVGVQLIYHIF